MIVNPTPRYYKIYRLLKQAIENREFAGDEALPGENALALKYQVSRLTIRRSLELLQNEGLVERRQGSGTYPILDDVTVQQLPADLNKLLDDLDKMGADTQPNVLSFTYETANPDVQARLQLSGDMQVQKAIRVRHYQGVPFSYLTTYVPADIGRRYTQDDLVHHSMQALLRRIGMRAASAEQTLTATLADADHASALRVDAGSALLCIKRVIRDAKNTPLQYLIAVYNPKRFEYRMALTIKRANGADAWITDHAR